MANYVNMDPTLVRVLTVVISLFTGVPIILYLIALFVIPEESSSNAGPTYYPPVNPPQYGQGSSSSDFVNPAQPSYAPSPSGQAGPTPTYGSAHGSAGGEDALWGTEGAPWEQRQQHPEETEAAAAPKSEVSPAPAPESEPAPPAPAETSAWETTGTDPDSGAEGKKPDPA